jgi:hypothetical protein
MQQTTNFGLQKPEPLIDNVDVTVLNGNMDKTDGLFSNTAKFEKSGGTATAITLTGIDSLIDGISKTFIASANNNSADTTINSKPFYKPGTTTAPNLVAGKAYTVWYDLAGDCFYTNAYANEDHDHVVADITDFPASMPANGGTAETISSTLPVNKGGTGATTAAGALTNLGLTATATELNYVDGVTSNVQTQLNGKAASSHNHAASNVTAGTLGGQVVANATAVSTLTTAQVRNIKASTTDLTAGSSALTTGELYVVYE